MMPTEDLDAVIRATLKIELSRADSRLDRLTRVLVTAIETRDLQLATAYGPGSRRTRAELLEALGVERHLPVPDRRDRDAVRASLDTHPDVIAERRAVLEQLDADEEPATGDVG
jgi:hypothetical protein